MKNLKTLLLFLLLLGSVSAYDYWIDDTNTSVWGELNITNGTSTMYYYGNCTKESESNISAAFLFGDDFNDGSVDSGIWTTSGTINKATGLLTLASNGAILTSKAPYDTFSHGTFMLSRCQLNDFGNVYFWNPNKEAGIVGMSTSANLQNSVWKPGTAIRVPTSTTKNVMTIMEFYLTAPALNQLKIGEYVTNNTNSVGTYGESVRAYRGSSGGTVICDYIAVGTRNLSIQPTVDYGSIEIDSFDDGQGATCGYRVELNITGTDGIDEYSVALNYSELGENGNGTLTEYGGGPSPVGGGNITVTLNAPTHLEVLYDKQVTFNYSVGMNNSPKDTNCSLYLDTINIFNDTTTTNDSFQHEHNTTFGNHTWSVFCYQNSTQNGTSGNFSFSVERNIELSQLLPAEASTTYNKTINASYELEANDNATCNFYFDGAHTYTDTYTHNETGPFNTTFNHIFSTTYGEHNWSIYCEMDNESEINETTDTRNFTIIFAVILVSPDNGVTLAGNTTNFEYTTTNLYQITCNISLDAAYIDEQTISSSGTRNYLSAVSDGSHIWHVKCFGGDNPDYSVQTTSRTFIMNVENYTYVVDLTSGPQNVLDSPQSLFYDIDGYLNALYFEDASPTDYLRIKTVNGSNLLTSYNTTLNATKSFFLVIRNPTNTSLITFGWDNSTEYIIDLDATGPNAILSEEPTTWNVLGNAVFDPYNYACTKQYDTIDYVADSHYFFMVPTTAGTKLVKKNITSAELEDIGTVNDNCNIVWNTMAKNQNLTQWYYVAPENYLTNNYISLYVYDGSGSTEIKQFDTDLYSQARVEGITVIFEEYEGKTYVLMANATDNSANPQDRIYIIEDNVTYEFGQNLEIPSHFFFIDENTFVFFDMRADATYAYSCYSNGSNLNCDEFSAAEYGLTVPYERGTMTTAKRTEENYDEVSKGAIVSADTVQLQYNQNIYNTKFICYDEQQEYRQQFKPRILSDTNSILASTYLWGYVIPGAEIGTGLKKVYNLGENGTLRMYLVGLDWGWNLDFYSLNETQGEYYTFTIKNQFNSPLEDVKVSAYRFSVVKNAFVVVEQGITDSTGAVTFFLEPFTPYRIVSEKDGYLVSTFDFVPTSTTEVEILLNQVETGIIADPSYESIWADVAYNFTPGGGFYNESVQFNFSCYSTDAAIEYYGVNVWKTTNGSTSLYYTNNITSQPSGGLIQVMLNKTENRTVRYVVDFWFKRQNYSSFEPVIPPTITIGEKKGLALVSRLFSGGNLMSPFFFYLIAIVIAMLVGGFVSQYTVEGAGLSSLAVLWIFTLFWLDAVIVAEPEITSLMATSLATLMVGAAMIIKHYV